MLPSVNKNSERELNPMPKLLYLYFSGPAFLVRFTDRYKQLFNVKSEFKFLKRRFSV